MEVLDMDLIRQQADNDIVDIQGLASYIITTMGKLCAPVRDEEIKKLRENTDNMVTLFRWVHAWTFKTFESAYYQRLDCLWEYINFMGLII